uniref:EF-hand domain-containing protein n=2 Tax=Cryptomonas curvata TaxID=233186 RepID=A0A7S0MVB5_9CRYP|mmetsp:Transcript_54951/g.115000  ORF Transcript_54951/g.115000 Transcript_54951/m.115000 type:complete len:1025 (+) Transcript_54951:289-3363(+)
MEIDFIPLAEIEFIKEMTEVLERRSSIVLDSGDGQAEESHALQISTIKDGHNSGRAYYLRVESQEKMETLMRFLQKSSKAARRRVEAQSFFRKSQHTVRKIYESNVVQGLIAVLIAASFICAIIEAQYLNPNAPDSGATDSHTRGGSAQADAAAYGVPAVSAPSGADPAEDGARPALAVAMERLNMAFTVLFAVELAVNALSYWFRPFVTNPWSILDTIVVVMSVAAAAATSKPTGIVRALRALRVIRLFGRIRSFRKIITALTMAMLPVFNVLLILFLLISLGAVIGVALFGEETPEYFGVFDLAFLTLFHVTTGEPWPHELPRLNADGSANWVTGGFTLVYTIIVHLVVMEVSVAVLLDNFIGASTRMEMDEKLEQAERKQREQQMKNPLEPLLLKLAREFSDSQDLSDRLRCLYERLDSDQSGGLDSYEFCAAINKLDFTPRIHISDSDFASITQDGELCDARGQLGLDEFERVMRRQIRHLAQSKLSLISHGDRSPAEVDFMQFGTLKMIFMEQTRAEDELRRTRELVLAALGVGGVGGSQAGSRRGSAAERRKSDCRCDWLPAKCRPPPEKEAGLAQGKELAGDSACYYSGGISSGAASGAIWRDSVKGVDRDGDRRLRELLDGAVERGLERLCKEHVRPLREEVAGVLAALRDGAMRGPLRVTDRVTMSKYQSSSVMVERNRFLAGGECGGGFPAAALEEAQFRGECSIAPIESEDPAAAGTSLLGEIGGGSGEWRKAHSAGGGGSEYATYDCAKGTRAAGGEASRADGVWWEDSPSSGQGVGQGGSPKKSPLLPLRRGPRSTAESPRFQRYAAPSVRAGAAVPFSSAGEEAGDGCSGSRDSPCDGGGGGTPCHPSTSDCVGSLPSQRFAAAYSRRSAAEPPTTFHQRHTQRRSENQQLQRMREVGIDLARLANGAATGDGSLDPGLEDDLSANACLQLSPAGWPSHAQPMYGISPSPCSSSGDGADAVALGDGGARSSGGQSGGDDVVRKEDVDLILPWPFADAGRDSPGGANDSES